MSTSLFVTGGLAGRVVVTLVAGVFFASSFLVGRAEADSPGFAQRLPTNAVTTDGGVTKDTAIENAVTEDATTEEVVVGEIRIDVISADEIPDEIPEEILRTEIITEARSPLTGEPMSAAEYAQLTEELRSSAGTPLLNSDIRYIIYLLQIRRAIKPIVPFL